MHFFLTGWVATVPIPYGLFHHIVKDVKDLGPPQRVTSPYL
jgi:hypothetical protein